MRVAVVGGGLAGLSAALELVDGGHEVTVHEARPTLGGAVQTLPQREGDPEPPPDNGQHVALGCFTDYLRFLAQYSHMDVTGGPRAVSPLFDPLNTTPLNKRKLSVDQMGGGDRISRPADTASPLVPTEFPFAFAVDNAADSEGKKVLLWIVGQRDKHFVDDRFLRFDPSMILEHGDRCDLSPLRPSFVVHVATPKRENFKSLGKERNVRASRVLKRRSCSNRARRI